MVVWDCHEAPFAFGLFGGGRRWAAVSEGWLANRAMRRKLALFFVLALFGSPLPSPRLSGKLKKLSVFGSDDRKDLPSDRRPWSAVGRIEILPPGVKPMEYRGKVAFCTGTLVSKDLALTNAHCLLDPKTKLLTKDVIWFRPGFRVGQQKSLATRAIRVWLGSLLPDSQRAKDWAIVKLESPVGESVGWLEVDAFPNSHHKWDPQQPTALLSYAMDFKDGLAPSIHGHCSITNFDPRAAFLRHNCDMNAGSSGGPLVWFVDATPHIVALNAAHMTRDKISYVANFTPEQANIAVGTQQFFGILETLKSNDVDQSQAAAAAFDSDLIDYDRSG